MGESYAVWSFLLSCVAGEVGWKSAGLGACGIVQGGQGFVTETCRAHKFVSVLFWALGSVEMSCNCLSFSNDNEYRVKVGIRPAQRQVFTWALLRRRAATDRLQGSPNRASLLL